MDEWMYGHHSGDMERGIRFLFGLERYLVSILLFKRSSYSSGNVIEEANGK
jgi:hypothetical protein